MTTISKPKMALGDPNRLANCKDALKATLEEMITEAEAAGWHGGEISCSLNALVKAHIRQRELFASSAKVVSLAVDLGASR